MYLNERVSNMKSDVRELFSALAEVVAQRKLIEAKEKELKDALKPHYEENAGTFNLEKHAITLSKMPGRAGIDKEAMKVDGIDVEKYTTIGKPYWQLSVKGL